MEKKKIDLNEFSRSFRRRFILKKNINMLVSFFIVYSAVTAILYSVYVNGSDFVDRLRYMTFDGTIYTAIISAIFVVICMIESIFYVEETERFVYFMRLSSATTEFVIFAVVMIGLSPLIPDQPDIHTYTGIQMHLIIPCATLLSFVFNDSPIGKLNRWEPFHGTWFITMYAVAMTILFGFRILPSELAPYSFLDFEHTSPLFSLACLIGIYVIGYTITVLLVFINRKLSWIWFFDFRRIPEYIRKVLSGNK